MEVLPAVGDGDVAIAAAIGVGALWAGAAVGGSVPAGEWLIVVEEEGAAA